MSDPRLLTLDETADLLKMSYEATRRMCAAGKLPAFKIGSRKGWRIEEGDFFRWLDAEKEKKRLEIILDGNG